MSAGRAVPVHAVYSLESMMAVQEVEQLVLRDMSSADIHALADLCFEQQWPHREEDLALLLSMGDGL
ncbi:MAG: hypothetical protein P8Y58_08605, partial [Novosphingobium sp.]